MNVQKIAAFSDGNTGGNPAGVVIAEQHPSEAEMRQIAADVGFSETAFAAPLSDAFRVTPLPPGVSMKIRRRARRPLLWAATCAISAGPTAV